MSSESDDDEAQEAFQWPGVNIAEILDEDPFDLSRISLDNSASLVDVLLWSEIVYCYLLDTSLINLLVRVIPFYHFFQTSTTIWNGKSLKLALDSRMMGAVVQLLFCMLHHLWTGGIMPASGRTYLTGGLFIDFIGQIPASRMQLLLVDIAIFILKVLSDRLSFVHKRTSQTLHDEEIGQRATETVERNIPTIDMLESFALESSNRANRQE